MNLKHLLKSNFDMDFPISGETGDSRNNPIVIRTKTPNGCALIEHAVLNCLCATKRMNWKIIDQTVCEHDGRALEQISIEIEKANGNKAIALKII